jgi:hypothetical protein
MKGAVVTWGQDRETVPHGPYQLLEQLLTACDQAIRDDLSLLKTRRARKVMNGVSFTKAWSSLPALCAGITLMSEADAAEMAHAVSGIGAMPIGDEARSALLGKLLIERVGPAVLQEALVMSGDEIKG